MIRHGGNGGGKGQIQLAALGVLLGDGVGVLEDGGDEFVDVVLGHVIPGDDHRAHSHGVGVHGLGLGAGAGVGGGAGSAVRGSVGAALRTAAAAAGRQGSYQQNGQQQREKLLHLFIPHFLIQIL